MTGCDARSIYRSALITFLYFIGFPKTSAENPLLDLELSEVPTCGLLTPLRETAMKIKNPEITPKDWQQCCTYVEEMKHKGQSAHEPWELELQRWAADPNRQPRRSTVARLRLRRASFESA